MNRHLGIVCVSAILCTGYSNEGLAAVSGTVTDTQGSPINHALVTYASESDSSIISRAVTDSLGHYVIADLPVGIREESPLPFSLGQNYPNPFNPSTTIPFTLDAPGRVKLTIYNIMGQTARTLVDSDLPEGSHNALWDGRDTAGKGVSSGVYLYRLVTNGRSQARKMLLLDGGGVSGVRYMSQAQKTAKQASAESTSLYTVTVERFPYTTYREVHLTVSTSAILDYTLQVTGELVSLPGSTFQMGDIENVGASDEKPVHTVTLTGFEMSVYEVTNARYAEYLNAALASGDIQITSGDVYGKTGLWSEKRYLDIGYGSDQTMCWILFNTGVFYVTSGYENWPVIAVTWYGSKAFANYYGLDLPTESEWEYACRGGNQYMYGTDDGVISSTKANYNNISGHPVTVGSYPANPYGLYDLSGNLYEWCHDLYGTYPAESATNPIGVQTGSYLVVRGGFWSGSDYYCRSSFRASFPPDTRHVGIGFRVVRRPGGVTY